MTPEKIEELIGQMTVTEKLGQLTQLAPFFLGMDPTMDLTGPMNEMNLRPEWIKDVGSTLNGFGAKELKALQDRHMANSRLHIPLLFMAFLLQAPSYALFVTCIVPYTEQSVAYEDSAKAQSLAFSTTTIASIIASILGGWMLDLTSVANCLYLAAAICLCGSLLIVYTLRKQERNG